MATGHDVNFGDKWCRSVGIFPLNRLYRDEYYTFRQVRNKKSVLRECPSGNQIICWTNPVVWEHWQCSCHIFPSVCWPAWIMGTSLWRKQCLCRNPLSVYSRLVYVADINNDHYFRFQSLWNRTSSAFIVMHIRHPHWLWLFGLNNRNDKCWNCWHGRRCCKRDLWTLP